MKTANKKVEESTNDSSDIGTPGVEITCTAPHLLEKNVKTTEEDVEKLLR